MIKTVVLSLLACAIIGGCAAIPKDTSVLTQQESTVYIKVGDDTCSGWVLKDSHKVVTAAHCAPSEITNYLEVDFGDGIEHKFYAEKVGDPNYKKNPDLMTLITNDQTIKWPPGLEVCKFKPYYDEDINIIGAPMGLKGFIDRGYVSNPNVDLKDQLGEFAFNDFIGVNAQMLPGNSGGAITDNNTGCVIGVAEAVIAISPMVPYGLNIATPATDLWKLQ